MLLLLLSFLVFTVPFSKNGSPGCRLIYIIMFRGIVVVTTVIWIMAPFVWFDLAQTPSLAYSVRQCR